MLSLKTVAALVATVLFQIALLINQLAQLHDFREETRQRRAALRAKREETRRAADPVVSAD